MWCELLSGEGSWVCVAGGGGLALCFGFFYEFDDEIRDVGFCGGEKGCGVGPEDVWGEA